MIKKLSIALFVTSSSLLLLSACTTTKVEVKNPPQKTVILPTQNLNECKSFQDAGKMMIESVIKGLSTNDYDLYSRDFTKQNKKYFNVTVFKQAAAAVKKELGEYTSKTFVGFWIKGNYTILLWKTRFTKTKDDILIEMYVTKTTSDTYEIGAVKVI
jgi:hypothetical protein